MRTILFLILLLIVSVFSYNQLPVYSDSIDKSHDEFSPEHISSFVSHLIKSGEYYRAQSELARLESYYPGYISPLCYAVTESYILYKSGHYSDINSISIPGSGSSYLCALNLFRIDGSFKSGDIVNNRELEGLLDYNCNDADYSGYYSRRRSYYSILGSFYNQTEVLNADDKYKNSLDYASLLSAEKKSPALGAICGIVPGMGYVYAGETGTGLVAMTVIAAGSAITWGAHVNNVDPLAAVSGAATFFMYTGSIAGGYIATTRYNRGLYEKLVIRLDKDFMLDRDLDDIYIKCGIEADVR